MNSRNGSPLDKLRGLSPNAVLVLGLLYVGTMSVLDYLTPARLSFMFFYVAGAAWVGWAAGKRRALTVALVTGVLILVHDWGFHRGTPEVGITLWNVLSRLAIVISAGWWAAETRQLTHNLGRQVEERTWQCQAEAQHHKATAETLRVFLDAMPEPAFLLDRQGTIVLSNVALARALQREPQTVVGRNAFELIPPAVAELRKAKFEQVLATGQPVQFEDQRQGRHIITFQSPLRDAEGTVSRVAVLALDITERKRAEQKLADALELNQKMFAASPMGIVAYKASGQCVLANEALARIVGGSLPQILQGNFRELKSWKESGLLRLAEEALETHQPRSAEIKDTSRFGKSFWVDALMAPFMSGGEPHLLHMAYDITERKRLERQILEISDREQARFGQDIHDGLCQELVSLAFDANSLQESLMRKALPEAATAQRLAALLDQAITEARQLSRGLFPVGVQTDGLHLACAELARTVRERFAVECRFESAGPAHLPDRVSAIHLYRIAQEAVNNAVKHSRAKLILLSLQADPHTLELKVEDNGRGLSAETQRSAGGMGLHIMDYRARSIGALLRFAARVGGGTVVSCRLNRVTP